MMVWCVFDIGRHGCPELQAIYDTRAGAERAIIDNVLETRGLYIRAWRVQK